MGYSLAIGSGQPHIIAHCCEQKLLSTPRLKSRDRECLKNTAIVMEKCLTMLQQIDEFVTSNSLGTIQKLTAKFTNEMQYDWMK